MLSIFVTAEVRSSIQHIIQSEDRLSELLSVHDSSEKTPESNSNSIIIDARGIILPIDWENTSPPYLLSKPLKLTKEVLLALIFNQLQNTEKAWSYLNEEKLLKFDLGIMNRLQHGYQIDLGEFPAMLQLLNKQDVFDQYRIQHNAGVVRHYGYLAESIPIQEVQQYYQQALEIAPNQEYKAFTAKCLASLLLDAGDLVGAEDILQTHIPEAISEEAKYGLTSVLCSVWMQQLTVPYDPALLERLKDSMWETLQFLEKNKRKAEAGLLYLDAAHIANISENFSESLGYVSKAIRFFEEEELAELVGNAQLRKGTLLYTWAQNDNPQFYKPAVEAFQQALKVFRQDVTPNVFADIHHSLAILYAEMPAENRKRGVWAGVSSASFQEALNYYTKETYPYEYGMICNNYGNALTKFPLAIHSDNYQKALDYYREALSVRSTNYPYERAISLLNFLEASWNVSNSNDEFNEDRYKDMRAKAEEVQQLIDDEDMMAESQKHLDMLDTLKQTVSK